MRIGVDVGGTKIEAVLLDDSGAMRWRERVATPRHDYEETLNAIVALVERGDRTAGVQASVGVGIPGTISPATGLVKNANSVWLIGTFLRQDLERRLRRPVRLANDANCFALSEAIDGAARGAKVVFGVILGTGTGGGIVVDGRVLVGANAIAGEWGHNPMPWPQPGEWPGPACYCGRTGCIETFLSGPGLVRAHAEAAGERLTVHEIVARAEGGHAAARDTLDRYVDRLARGLAHVINIIDPDVIVLGGGLSNAARLHAGVPERWTRYVFSDRVDTRLVRAAHGDSSGVRGAAWLWGGPGDAVPAGG